ncbi:MAG: DNA translocase FtsK [Flavobacteriales bacterium]|nr:DNA translocase FtsK [Flavobacteriales bacterium]
MAKRSTAKAKPKKKKDPFFSNKNIHLIIGIALILVAVSMFISFTSYLWNWQADQSELSQFWDKGVTVDNLLGKIGANISHLFIYSWFGIASYIIALLIFKAGLIVSFKLDYKPFLHNLFKNSVLVLWLSVALSFFFSSKLLLGGIFGYEITTFTAAYAGSIGVSLLLFFTLVIWLIFRFDLTPQSVNSKLNSTKDSFNNWKDKQAKVIEDDKLKLVKQQKNVAKPETDLDDGFDLVINNNNNNKDEELINPIGDLVIENPGIDAFDEIPKCPIKEEKEPKSDDLDIIVEAPKEEVKLNKNLSEDLVDKFGEFDPELELGSFQFPELDSLVSYDNENISIDREELEANKNRIVETLNNYKIEISKIKATIGPTVTLYEIVPAPGVRISKIKNLEDDIALSLSALGIRIIAPIPGKGTIGIEVPNKKPTIVSMKSVLASSVFQNSKMDLPIALGKTISNTTYVTDLAKMPHLLVAGATGQGKSVGLNAIMASLLYKKHPSELKFILVDPKKVELTLFNKIERHYLAKLPDTDSAIITDTTKVVNTLNSLCIEMDDRYELLKNAMVRNIKEYNHKFKKRKLNPENGHKFLPYIVLVIDEFADLIMTAGKEVETPIARLAQLARAVGIHLIVATQRPSVNVITGIIKANFPARLAFRVTSKIDSRTILDEGGANQLIGKGDMLLSNGNETVRLQCAFVDTPEIEAITNFIGDQKGYAEAYMLPEYVGDENSGSTDIDIDDRDAKFDEAARLIVNAQQGSASLLQRKLKLGYNRAGRIVDQLEAAGIIGPFEGSKARQVLVPDEASLQMLLKKEEI